MWWSIEDLAVSISIGFLGIFKALLSAASVRLLRRQGHCSLEKMPYYLQMWEADAPPVQAQALGKVRALQVDWRKL